MRRDMSAHRASQGGVTLIEVLVAVVVLSIGLLGVAGLQAAGLRFTQNAALRSQAVVIATDIADRIRSNPDGLAAGYYNSFSSADHVNTATPNCITEAGGCNPQELANYHIRDWSRNTVAAMPGGASATVTCGADNCQVVVTWTGLEKSGVSATPPKMRIAFVPSALL